VVCYHQPHEGGGGLRVLLTAERGTEGLLASDIKGVGDKIIPSPFSFSGRVLLEGVDERGLLKLLYTQPLYHKAALVLEVAEIPATREALDACYLVARQSEIPHILSPSLSFGVRSVRKGNHPFTSQEVAAYAGAGVIDGCRAKRGFRPRVNLSDPDLLVVADVCHSTLILGVELVGLEGLHRRGWRVYTHPAGIKSTLANALLKVAGFENEALWDPMCGSGTICIEAAHRAIGLAPGYFKRESFLFLRSGILSPSLWREVTEESDSRIKWDLTTSITGSDRVLRHIEGARANAESALVKDKVSFHHLPLRDFSDTRVETIVTNPPYGIRLSGPKGARRSLEELFTKAASLKDLKSLVLIHPDAETVGDIASKYGFCLDKAIAAYNGNLEVFIFKIAPSPSGR